MQLILPITLSAAAAAAVINAWLGFRIGQIRIGEKISIGDGGNPRLVARMRAQLNFVEYTPLVLILIGLIELAKGPQLWLSIVAGTYMLARVLHGFGMDGWSAGRTVGAMVTMLTTLGLGVYAAVVALV